MIRRLALTCASFGLIGCGWDYTPSDNLLGDPTTDEETTGDDDPDTNDEAEDPTETGDETGGEEPFPATYRFDCIDIKSMGDADETVFQVVTLQNTWAADIKNFKLNILIDLLTEDAPAETGVVTIRSGVGPNAGNQCGQGETDSAEFPVVYQPTVGTYERGEGMQCAVASDASASGTYTLDMSADEKVFIYAEDDDGTPFNCSLEPDGLPAIPIWAVDATLSMSTDRDDLSGTLRGCVLESEAASTCSCLSVCGGTEHPDCGGCPAGAIPLGLLLGGIETTPNCSDLMGEPAFDIVIEFSASRLGDVPETCG